MFFHRLSVVSNNIEGEGLVVLSQSMKTNPVLSNIYIWGNKFDEATCVVRFLLYFFWVLSLTADIIYRCLKNDYKVYSETLQFR